MTLFTDKLKIKAAEAELAAERSLHQLPPLMRWLFIACVLATVPSYYAAKGISAKYWEGNLRQYSLIAKPSFSDPQDPKVETVAVTTTGNNVYAIVAIVQNENLDLSADNIPYRFHLANAGGREVMPLSGSVSGEIFLLPNQKKYVVAPRITVAEPVVSASLEMEKNIIWRKKISLPQVNLVSSNPNLYNQYEPMAFVAEGSFQNQSPYNLGRVRLVFFLYDQNKRIISVSQRDEFTVKPYERRGYKQLWPGVYSTSVASAEVFAETDILDQENIFLPDSASSGTPASDLSRPEQEQW